MFLVHRVTQKKVPAEIEPVDRNRLIALRSEFTFDWQQELRHEVYAVTLPGENKTAGLVALKDVPDEFRIEIVLLECSRENVGSAKEYDHVAGCLIAFACRLAFLRGYFGFVSLTPKTQIIQHYMKTYGFRQYGRQLAVDLEDAQSLIEKYLNYGQ